MTAQKPAVYIRELNEVTPPLLSPPHVTRTIETGRNKRDKKRQKNDEQGMSGFSSEQNLRTSTENPVLG
jgi:hypothetical protein